MTTLREISFRNVFRKKIVAVVLMSVLASVGVVIAQDTVAIANSAATSNPGAEAIEKKLKSILIDKVDFKRMDIRDVVQFLSTKSKEFDPEKTGVKFVLQLPPKEELLHREVSITLDNVSLEDILTYTDQQTNLQYSIEGDTVYLRPAETK